MKRLKFKKQFTSIDNALKSIPDHFRIDNYVFEITDGIEKYVVRWEGSVTEGKAVVIKQQDGYSKEQNIENKNPVILNEQIVKSEPYQSNNLISTKKVNKSKSLLFAGIAFITLFLIYLFFFRNTSHTTDQAFERSADSSVVVAVNNNSAPVINTEPNLSEILVNNSPNELLQSDVSALTEKLKHFYLCDNQENIDEICNFFSYPVMKYYNQTNVSYDTLKTMFESSFHEKLRYHNIDIYWSSSTVQKISSGFLVNLQASYHFITNKLPDQQKNRNMKIVLQLDDNKSINSIYEIQ